MVRMRVARVGVVLLAFLLLPVVAALGPAGARAADPVRILLYGDSITQGSTGDYTWRYFLDGHLRSSGVSFDLVGPRSGLHHLPEPASGAPNPDDQGYVDPAFDTDAAAVWGQTLAMPTYDLANTSDAPDLVTDLEPDVIVALIGVNDLNALRWTPQAVADLMSDKIAAARQSDPGVSMVLVQVPEVWFPGVPEYNDDLATLAARMDTPNERVVATALADLDMATDTFDGMHPTATGSVKIARVVEDALAGIGLGRPGTSPAVTNGPRSASTLSATPGREDVALSWYDVPGATSEWLEQRDVSADADWSRDPVPFASGQVSSTAANLVPGHRYEFRLRPAKGNAISADLTSPVVTVVPGPRPPAPVLDMPITDAGGRFTITWVPADDATTYAVDFRDASAGEGWRPQGTTTATRWTAGDLVNGDVYEVRVRADSGTIEGATSSVRRAAVPLLDAVARTRARSPRVNSVRTRASTVPFATGYRVLVAGATSCRRTPRPAAFRARGGTRTRPVAHLRTTSRALWVRWYAVRKGVPGALAPTSTRCTPVR